MDFRGHEMSGHESTGDSVDEERRRVVRGRLFRLTVPRGCPPRRERRQPPIVSLARS